MCAQTFTIFRLIRKDGLNKMTEMSLKNTLTVNDQRELSQSDCERLDKLCLWIDAHICDSISWTELTQHSGWQHSELIKKFVAYKGTTPMAYIIEGIKSKRLKSPVKPPSLNAFLRKNTK